MLSRTFILALIVAAVSAAAWDSYNDPTAFGETYNYVLGGLQTQATLSVIPWTDNYWPSCQSGIAHRWNSGNPQDFQYQLMSLNDLLQASSDTIAALSPAEKYDIYKGRFDYPTVQSEWKRTHATDPDWEGICHGWSPAAGLYLEPQPFSVNTSQGIILQFGSADMKGLLSYFNAEVVTANSYFLGQRCNTDLQANPSSADSLPECADLHPATFHLILTNQISMNKFFVADVDRGVQVWNQPIFQYSYTVNSNRAPSANAAPGTVTEADITMTMTYSRESTQQWAAHGDNPVTFSRNYEYYLELDGSNNILGGSWVSFERADFAWKNSLVPFSGYWSGLTQLYALSQNQPVNNNNAPIAMASMLTKANHRVHTNKVGSFAVTNYGPSHSQSWVIAPVNAKSITLTFPSFSTAKTFDKLKVYEGADGEGALVAVYHGQRVPETLKLKVSSVFVTFESDRQSSGAGFRVNYKSN